MLQAHSGQDPDFNAVASTSERFPNLGYIIKVQNDEGPSQLWISMVRYNVHQVQIIQTGLDHPECVNFGSDGRLYAGGFAGQVYVMTPPNFELRQLVDTRGYLGGVATDADHNVYACDTTHRCIQRVDQKGGITIFCDNAPDGPLVVPNYGSFDSLGNYYFSDSGEYWKPTGRLIRVSKDKRVESLIGSNWHFANGLAISPKDGSIFMIESTAADILRVPIGRDGTAGSQRSTLNFRATYSMD